MAYVRRRCVANVRSWWKADIAHPGEKRQLAMMQRRSSIIASALPFILSGCSQTPITYAADCSTPLAHWGREKDGVGHLRVVQPVYIASDGSILWNQRVTTDATLRRYMSQMSGMSPEPQAVLDASPSAACSRVTAIRSIMDAAPMCKGPHSLCSEGWNWRQWPELGGP